jgi:hypothetical protein
VYATGALADTFKDVTMATREGLDGRWLDPNVQNHIVLLWDR